MTGDGEWIMDDGLWDNGNFDGNVDGNFFIEIFIWNFHRSLGGKGWEETFLIQAFGLSEELSTEVGFAFSKNGLKSQDL